MTAALVQNGARVYIASRKLHDLESVAASMNETARGGPWPAGTACIPLQADLSSKAGCDALAAELARHTSRLDILVNNAAYQRSYEKFEEIPQGEIETTFKTNVFPIFYLTQAAAAHLRPGACVINTSSIQALSPTPGLIFYAATKSAISSMTKSLAGLLADKGIRVNAVAPGPVWTPLIPSTLDPGFVKQFGSHTAFKRPAQPVEQATLFVFLASDDASYVTGEVFGATGGQTPI